MNQEQIFLSPKIRRNLLEVNTAGSVDNGKSTLIGRLLYDSGGLTEDRIKSIAKKSLEAGNTDLNLAFFTDGLKAESENGITIDVARHFVARNNLDLIISDTPGHLEFTRNTVTGTSTSQLTLILVDATKGIVSQNRRHAYIAALLGVENIAVLINKMDLVDYSLDRFNQLRNEFDQVISKLKINQPNYIPISALNGDNVVYRSANLNWYQGHTVISLIEDLAEKGEASPKDLRFIVQWVNRLNVSPTQKEIIYGHVAGGQISRGDQIFATASHQETKVSNLHSLTNSLETAFFSETARLELKDSLQIERGEVLTHPKQPLVVRNSFVAEVCWLNENNLLTNKEYLIQVNGKVVTGTVDEIINEVDLNSFSPTLAKRYLSINDLATVRISLAEAVPISIFATDKSAGKFIIIDPNSKKTAGAGVVIKDSIYTS